MFCFQLNVNQTIWCCGRAAVNSRPDSQPSNFFLNPEIDFGSVWFNNMTRHYPWMMGSYPKHFQLTNINLIEFRKVKVKEVICILKWAWRDLLLFTVAVCEEIDCISFHIKFHSGEATNYWKNSCRLKQKHCFDYYSSWSVPSFKSILHLLPILSSFFNCFCNCLYIYNMCV